MEHLYAPWREAYLVRGSKKKTSGCFFCRNLREKNDAKNLILFRRSHSFILMNLFPYNDGHLMIAPLRHRALPTELSTEEWVDFNEGFRQAMTALQHVFKPDGFNMGMNLGKAAGAGVGGHLHLHLVPRWIGDTNFMPVTGSVKLINQDLKKVYRKLAAAF